MRILSLILLPILLIPALGIGQAPPRPIRPPGPPSLMGLLTAAAEDLESLPQEDRYQTRYIVHWPGDDKESIERRRTLRWWISQLSMERAWIPPLELEGGRLWRLDLRDYRWTPAAWQAVAERDPYLQQPLVSDPLANRLRQAIGYTVKKGTGLPVVAALRADWLFRETIETNRSTAYYDLLFARQRHGATGLNNAARAKIGLAPKGNSKDFPADENDWNEAFGIKATNDFLASQRINLAAGAVVAGSVDDPVRGSIVARNNRLLWFIPVPTGAAFKTFDVDDTGKNDFLETSPELPAGKVPFKAAEFLVHLPNGGMASFLTNEQSKRIERGDIDVVHNRVDSRFADVRNPMGCVICHAPDGGFIQPKNLVDDLIKAGVDVKIKDRETRNLYRSFFLEWDERFTTMRTPYEKLIERTTAEQGQKKWSGAELVAAFVKYRDTYDNPLKLKDCAAELDCPEDRLKLALTRSPLARLNGLALGMSIPRRSWEASLHGEASKLIALEK